MFELHAITEVALAPGAAAASMPRMKARSGVAALSPFADAGLQASLLVATLDEIDYGMLLVDSAAEVLQCNRAARVELGEHPLRLLGNRLSARELRDMVPLRKALLDACLRGRRRLLIVGAPPQRKTLAIVPLQIARDGGTSTALVMLAKREVCVCLSVEAFARAHRLTWAETRVLKALCGGARPSAIALAHGVGMATVRSQLRAIRAKTGTADVGSLLRLVAVLPPMVGALRNDSYPPETGDRVAYGRFGSTVRAPRGAAAARPKIGTGSASAP